MRNNLFVKSYKLWLVNVCKYLCHFMLTQVSLLRDLDADVCWGLQALRFGICFAMAWFGTLENPMIGVWWKEICGTRRLLKFRRYSCVWSFYGRLVETMMSVHWPWCNQYCIGMAHGSILTTFHMIWGDTLSTPAPPMFYLRRIPNQYNSILCRLLVQGSTWYA